MYKVSLIGCGNYGFLNGEKKHLKSNSHFHSILKIKKLVEEKGRTLVPFSLYFQNGKAKLEFGLGQGKKLWDKRKSKMEKDISRQIDRELKRTIK